MSERTRTEDMPSPDARPEMPNESSVAIFKSMAEKLTDGEAKHDEDYGEDYKEAYYRLKDGRIVYVKTSEAGSTDPHDFYNVINVYERGPSDNPWEITKTFFESDGKITKHMLSASAQEKTQFSADMESMSSLDEDEAALDIEHQLESDEDFDMPVEMLAENDELPEGFTPGPHAKLNQPSNLDEVDENLSHNNEHSDIPLLQSIKRSDRATRLQKFGKEKGFDDMSQHEMNELNSLLQSITPEERITEEEADIG